jgi:exosortase A-associated hydrolase 2
VDSSRAPLGKRTQHAWFEQLHARADGERFCIRHEPPGPIQGYVLYVHPFAEELNCSRRMAALQAQRLAANGFEVWQADLYGCGDSPGDFGAATWDQWTADVRGLTQQLLARAAGDAPVWLWGLRLGCILAAQAAQALEGPLNFLFWQPLLNGQSQLHQLLRLVAAGELLAQRGAGEAAQLRERIAQHQSVEIGGYALDGALLDGVQSARLHPPQGTALGRTIWLESTSATMLASVAPPVIQACQSWIEAGAELHYQQVVGPSFWQIAESADATELMAATTAMFPAADAAHPQRASRDA